jgi:hypothetical protein
VHPRVSRVGALSSGLEDQTLMLDEIKARSAVSRLARTLGPLVTNADILDAAAKVGVKLYRSQRVDRLDELLLALLSDGRRRNTATEVIYGLVRAAASAWSLGPRKQAEMTEQHADSIVAEMRLLKLSTGGLERKGWRKGLAKPVVPPGRASAAPAPIRSSAARGEPLAKVHEEARERIGVLAQGGCSPQHRGRELEQILFSVLREERLDPELHKVSPGEEIDVVFTMGELHCVTECKWTRERIGLPEVRLLAAKASTKLEGTFGVVLSMNGYVEDINAKVSMGGRQNSVGLDASHLMAVLDGRATWAKVVRDARKLASRRTGIFYTPFNCTG